tara:strand:+ start:491 stop:1099 length:609 start_codon:yes stop_codon:yes gene_type:complete
MSKGNDARVLDVFGPNFLIETNGPVGVGGGVAYQIYSINDKEYKWQQALHQSGLATMEADGSLEIQTGAKNKEGDVSYIAMAHKGDMAMTAENGWVRIYGRNIVLQAAEELHLQGNTVKLGNKANETLILGRRIELGDKEETKEVVVPRGRRITRESGNIFLKASKNGLSGIGGMAIASFISSNRQSLVRPGEFTRGMQSID